MILPLTKHPEKTLWEPSVPVTHPTSDDIATLIHNMYETMIDADGIGIAAPQVGKNIRLFLVRVENAYEAFINPTVSRKSFSKTVQDEGCLSVPGHFGPVKRSKELTVAYTTEAGEIKKQRAKGLFARVIQHEFDHIEGALFLARATHVDPPVEDPIP
jgi:peptide deformylase